MSFILDALKKLEQKRQRGSVPDLMTVHIPVPQEVKKRPIWPYLIIAALVLNAALLLVWLRPWIPSSNVIIPAVKPASEVKQKSLSAPKAAKQRSTSEQPNPKPPAVTAKKTAEETLDIHLPKTTTDNSLNTQHFKESVSINQPKAADVNKSMPGNSLPELSQLPQSTQSEIPQLKILGHVYSNSPGTRLININGDIYKEGDTAGKNLKVEEITETGVILNYNGTRFLIRAF
jgi:general secretion pathway protein B